MAFIGGLFKGSGPMALGLTQSRACSTPPCHTPKFYLAIFLVPSPATLSCIVPCLTLFVQGRLHLTLQPCFTLGQCPAWGVVCLRDPHQAQEGTLLYIKVLLVMG